MVFCFLLTNVHISLFFPTLILNVSVVHLLSLKPVCAPHSYCQIGHIDSNLKYIQGKYVVICKQMISHLKEKKGLTLIPKFLLFCIKMGQEFFKATYKSYLLL